MPEPNPGQWTIVQTDSKVTATHASVLPNGNEYAQHASHKYYYDFEEHLSLQQYLPDKPKGKVFYKPSGIKEGAKNLKRLVNWKKDKKQ